MATLNSIVIPVQTYASEIWICDFKVNFDTIDKLPSEKLQNMIFKNVLGVHGKALNLAVHTEMSSLPVCIKAYKLLYKYYLRLKSFDEHPDSLHSILRAAYKEDSELSQCNKSASCLTNTLKSILKLDSQNITFSHFSDVLERYYKTKVTSELEHIKHANSGKLVFYSTIYHDFSLKII